MEDSRGSQVKQDSSRGLDGLNFFVAAMQTAFGAFVTVYLVRNLWPSEDIGFALTISPLCSLISQAPRWRLH